MAVAAIPGELPGCLPWIFDGILLFLPFVLEKLFTNVCTAKCDDTNKVWSSSEGYFSQTYVSLVKRHNQVFEWSLWLQCYISDVFITTESTATYLSLFTGLYLANVLQCINSFAIIWVGTALCPPPPGISPDSADHTAMFGCCWVTGTCPGYSTGQSHHHDGRAEAATGQAGPGHVLAMGWIYLHLSTTSVCSIFHSLDLIISQSFIPYVLFPFPQTAWRLFSNHKKKKKAKRKTMQILIYNGMYETTRVKVRGYFTDRTVFPPLLSVNSIKRYILLGFKIF